MERSAIKYLKKKGKSNTEIASDVKHHRNTVAKVLKEPVDRVFSIPLRPSRVDRFRPEIEQWLQEGINVNRMLEMVREDFKNTYTGSRSAFYDRVSKIKKELELKTKEAVIIFEGLPGEYLQIDWGEIRNFPFCAIPPGTRYVLKERFIIKKGHLDNNNILQCSQAMRS
ncbi:hypothetical protein ACFL35_16535 [Candidatus Riflebacteria bacterium]